MSQGDQLRQTLCNENCNSSAEQLEIYKLSVEMADRISARRLTASSFFLTINTGIIAFAGYLSLSEKKDLAAGQYWIIALAGIVLCYMWYRLIRSYAGLNKAKFAVIQEMEKDLTYKVYDAEWIAVGEGNDPKKYLPFTKIEMAVPWVFLIIHAIVLVKAIPTELLPVKLEVYFQSDLSEELKEAANIHFISAHNVRLRKKPSIQSDVLEQLKFGQVVSVVEQKDSWSKVVIDERYARHTEGWVYTEYIHELKN